MRGARGCDSHAAKPLVVRSALVLVLALGVAASGAFVRERTAAAARGRSVAAVAEPATAMADRGPARVKTWYYYGLNDVNAGVRPALMAAYADYVEDDGFAAEHARAFKAAGGRFAGAYTDPAYVPYCRPPFAPPAGKCDGPLGNAGEGAWFHGRDGTRVRRYVDAHFQYQEALNPLSPDARRAWHAFTEGIVAKAPWLDFFFADDAGGPLHAGDMSPRSSEFYDFNEAGSEITSDEVFRDAWTGYLAQSVRPLVLNGYDPTSGLPAYGGAFLRPAFVWGEVHEGCFRGAGGLETERRDRWTVEEASLLANTALRKLAVCFMMGSPTPPARLYALASWWLGYDPQWSVMAPIDPVPGGSSLLPETELVPAYPLRTARSSADELRDATGVYVREFGRCYLRGVPAGPCAAFVNPTLRPLEMPRAAARYRHALVLDDRDVPRGGRVSWTGPVPAILPASSALILGG